MVSLPSTVLFSRLWVQLEVISVLLASTTLREPPIKDSVELMVSTRVSVSPSTRSMALGFTVMVYLILAPLLSELPLSLVWVLVRMLFLMVVVPVPEGKVYSPDCAEAELLYSFDSPAAMSFLTAVSNLNLTLPTHSPAVFATPEVETLNVTVLPEISGSVPCVSQMLL